MKVNKVCITTLYVLGVVKKACTDYFNMPWAFISFYPNSVQEFGEMSVVYKQPLLRPLNKTMQWLLVEISHYSFSNYAYI